MKLFFWGNNFWTKYEKGWVGVFKKETRRGDWLHYRHREQHVQRRSWEGHFKPRVRDTSMAAGLREERLQK